VTEKCPFQNGAKRNFHGGVDRCTPDTANWPPKGSGASLQGCPGSAPRVESGDESPHSITRGTNVKGWPRGGLAPGGAESVPLQAGPPLAETITAGMPEGAQGAEGGKDEVAAKEHQERKGAAEHLRQIRWS